jgi:hypothetical protein
MKENVLKNETDFLAWKDRCTSIGDIVAAPVRYPCLARTYVSSWNYQEETSDYLYREDIAQILAEFDA